MSVVVEELYALRLALELQSPLYPAELSKSFLDGLDIDLQDECYPYGSKAVKEVVHSGSRESKCAEILSFIHRVKADRQKSLLDIIRP